MSRKSKTTVTFAVTVEVPTGGSVADIQQVIKALLEKLNPTVRLMQRITSYDRS